MRLVEKVIPGIPMVSYELSSDKKGGRIPVHHTCRYETNKSARQVGDISLIPREWHQRYEIETKSRKPGTSLEYSSSMRTRGTVVGPGRIRSKATGNSIRRRSG
jgi:hypothetical protein